jgi:LPS-assembly protein
MPKPQRLAYALSALFTVTLPAYAQIRPSSVRRAWKTRTRSPSWPKTSAAARNAKTLERDAELVKDKTRVKADTACYRQVEDEVEAKGNVKIWRFGDYFTGDELKLNMDTGKGYMLNPTYQLEANHARARPSASTSSTKMKRWWSTAPTAPARARTRTGICAPIR